MVDNQANKKKKKRATFASFIGSLLWTTVQNGDDISSVDLHDMQLWFVQGHGGVRSYWAKPHIYRHVSFNLPYFHAYLWFFYKKNVWNYMLVKKQNNACGEKLYRFKFGCLEVS